MGNLPIRRTPRLARFDYSSSGSYFLTICTQNMDVRFGGVHGSEVLLNEAGEMVTRIWESACASTDGYESNAYVFMPNHLHAIVHVGTNPVSRPQPLDRFVGAFKSRSTVEYIRGVKNGMFPAFDGQLWQRSFYDRALRTRNDVEAAIKYIEANPHRWEEKRLSGNR